MTKLSANKDCQDFLDQALETEGGIAIELESPGMAARMMQRLNTYRKAYRERSKAIYEPTSPQWATSPWDHLVIKRDPENPHKVIITAKRINVVGVTPL